LLLWNHVLSTNAFSWSDATETSGGTKLPTNIKTWSGSTKNCLSCHDGTVEIGKIYHPATTFDAAKITGDAQIATATGDLKGNHPVAVPYPYGGLKNTYNGITTGDLALTSGWKAAPTKVKIFADPAGGANNKGMECASCHDPHGTGITEFLRDVLTGSALCLDCHTK
jgi:predicted CXXCH cytochrome family protein